MRSSRFRSAATSVLVTTLVGGLAAAWIAGWRIDVVTSASMAPAIPRDSLVVLRPVSPVDVEVGDVVAYPEPTRPSAHVLHRVIERTRAEAGFALRTQGDANSQPDSVPVEGTDLLGTKVLVLPKAGPIARAITDPRAPILLVGLPGMAFIIGIGRDRLRRQRARALGGRPLIAGGRS